MERDWQSSGFEAPARTLGLAGLGAAWRGRAGQGREHVEGGRIQAAFRFDSGTPTNG